MTSIHEPREFTDMIVRGVPTRLHLKFRSVAIKNGLKMKTALLLLMQRYIDSDGDMLKDEGQE